MATTFNKSFNRSDDNDRLARELPEEVVDQIIQDAEQTSAALAMGNVRRMNSTQVRFRLTNSFPDAYWINGTTAAGDKPSSPNMGNAFPDGSQSAKDFGLKQTTAFSWDNAYLTVDELAVLVVMPDNWRDDSDIAWEEIRAALRTAFAKAIDEAVFYGRSNTSHPLPASFGDGLIPDTIAAGNVINEGTFGGYDLADAYAALGQDLEDRGYDLNGYVVGKGEKWRLRRLRDNNDLPLLGSFDSPSGVGLYGVGLTEVTNGVWDKSVATAIAGQWDQLHIGIRQDITFDLRDTAMITNQAGQVVYNAFQQDGEVLRAVMRMGYAVTDPLKHLTGAREYPFSVLVPAGSSAS